MADDKFMILVVDDEPNNLKLMKQILAEHYRLAFAPNGAIAMDVVDKVTPDLILLDIMMPEMDGYEVCRRLKSDPRTREIPVIFVTAKSDESDEAKGFEIGAVDYITKPVSPPIVLGRTRNHLELKQAREYLKHQNEILERRVEERTREVLDLQQVEFKLRAAKEKVENELNIASGIQKSILPSRFPAFPGRNEFELHATMTPAREVGGDFYDYFFVDDDTLVLVIADVAGKGVPAALFVMNCRTVLRSIAKQSKSPPEVLSESNALLCEDNDSGMFVSVLLGYYHVPSGRLTYSNAGHNPPVLCGNGTTCRELIKKHGSALGGIAGISYGKDVQQIAPGQVLVMYTDGVTEARSPENEFFGLQRLKDLVSDCCGSSLLDMCRQIDEHLKDFQRGSQFDDMTMLLLRRDK